MGSGVLVSMKSGSHLDHLGLHVTLKVDMALTSFYRRGPEVAITVLRPGGVPVTSVTTFAEETLSFFRTRISSLGKLEF